IRVPDLRRNPDARARHRDGSGRDREPSLRRSWARPMNLHALVEDTFAEGFRSIYGEVLITARDEKWLRHCVHAFTGHASSTILCDCEAGVAEWIDADR